MKRSKGNRYEFTAQLLFMILGLVFLYSHFCELVALTGWNVLNYVYYFEAIDNFLFFIVPFVQAGVFFLIALAIKERRWDLAAVASALLCINSILQIVLWGVLLGDTLYTIGMISNLVAFFLLGITIALKKEKEKIGRRMLLVAMILFGAAAVPEVVAIFSYCYVFFIVMKEAAWVIEAGVFVYFCYCLQKGKITWAKTEKSGTKKATRNAANGDGWSDEIVELEKAAQLHKQGVLTEEEFQKMKSEILKKKEGEQN